jgi:hypothetical protein
MSRIMIAACAVMFVSVVLQIQAADRATVAQRSAFAECGAYKVTVTGHDAASADDAFKAALTFLNDGCEIGSGVDIPDRPWYYSDSKKNNQTGADTMTFQTLEGEIREILASAEAPAAKLASIEALLDGAPVPEEGE